MRPHLLTLLAATACTGTTVKPDGVMVEVDGSEPVRLELADAVGSGGVVEVPVRLVNSFGIAVPGTTMVLSVQAQQAALESTTVQVDASGYALARVLTPTPEAFVLSATSSSDVSNLGETVYGFGLPDDFLSVDVSRATLLPEDMGNPTFIARCTDGVAIASDDEVWWLSAEGGAIPHRVADLPFPIEGMESGHIDADGVLDLVVWAGSDVIMLRGRNGGGFGWGTAFRAEDQTIGGASIADMDHDRLTDVSIAIGSDIDGAVQVLLGDGGWGFDQMEPLLTDFPVIGIAAADELFDGRPNLTIIDGDTHFVRRYTLTSDGWGGGSPPRLIESSSAYVAPDNSRLLPMADLDLDGNLDVSIAEGVDGASQSAVFFTLGAATTRYEKEYGPFYPALGDVDGNGSLDIVAYEDEVVHVVRYDDLEQGFTAQNVNDVSNAGPIDVIDWNGDGTMDMAAAVSDIVHWYTGAFSDTGLWTIEDHGWRQYAIDQTGAWSLTDFSDDGITDIVGFKDIDGEDHITIWRFFYNDSNELQAQTVDTLTMDGRAAQDVVTCDDGDAFALGGTGTSTRLYQLSILASGNLWALAATADQDVTGSWLECGETDGSDAIFVIDSGGEWAAYKRSNLSEIDSGNVGSIGGAAVADTDGDGDDEVYGCSGTDCQIVGADLDGDGTDELITGSADGITVEGWGTTQSLPGGAGVLSVADLRGDGRASILSADASTGRLLVYDGLVGGAAPPRAMWTDRDMAGELAVGDVDGDGVLEFIMGNGEGSIAHTAASSETDDDGGSDTGGDTGAR